MEANPWFYVAWVGGVCLCIIILVVTLNIIVAVLRNIRKPPPPPPPIFPPPVQGPQRDIDYSKWDGNGRA